MAIEVRHKFQSMKPDSPDNSLIRPSNWNDNHDITMAGSRLFGRSSSTAGPVEEIELGDGLEFASGALALSQNVIPIGTVVDYAGTTPPPGWAFCAGQAVSRSTFAALFEVIGTTFGVGNGSTTFNLPDARGRVVAGRDGMVGSSSRLSTIDGGTLGAVGGSQEHTLTTNQIPSHSHTGTTNTTGNHNHSVPAGSTTPFGSPTHPGAVRAGNSNVTSSTAGNHSHTLNINNTGGGRAHNNLQPTLVLNKIIRTGV